jgi:hypothetical protein
MPSFSKEQIRRFLSDHDYTSNPDGLIQHIEHDYVTVNDTVSYLDVSAIAVRKGKEVPDRPIRITFQKVSDGQSSYWKLKSVAELGPGIESKALDREPDFPKVSPWRCPHAVAPGVTCVRAEGHDGPCSSGIKSSQAVGSVFECTFCGEKFATLPDFDAHAPCPKS